MWSLLLLSLLFLSFCLPVYNSPALVPALQSWQDSAGSFHLLPNCRIQYISGAALQATSQALQDDLLSLTSLDCTVSTLTSLSGNLSGSIVLWINTSFLSSFGAEAYQLSIFPDHVLVSGSTDGIFWGTRTLLQMMTSNEVANEVSNEIPCGVALDYPRYPFRGFHMDMGRFFVTTDWLGNMIKQLSYLKIRYFHWHLAENDNFRIECTSHPEIVAAQYYTKMQVELLQELADLYHVIIIPEIEMPAHMSWALDPHPEWRVTDENGIPSDDKLDLTNNDTYLFVNQLLTEFLPLFTGPYFHIGTDEYLTSYTTYPQFVRYAQQNFGPQANAQDVYLHFVNWADSIVQGGSKTTLAWDDNKAGGSVFTLNTNMVMDSWTFNAQNEIDLGFQVINSAQASLYFVWFSDWEPMQTELYETWSPNQWSYSSPGSLAPYANHLLGAKLEIWMDQNHAEEYSLAYLFSHSLCTLSQKTWASPQPVPLYTSFKSICDQVKKAPGTTFPNTYPPIVVINGLYTGVVNGNILFWSNGTMARNGSIASYKWDFGDGATSSSANPIHSYGSANTYSVMLTVTDSHGMIAANTVDVYVGISPHVTLAVVPDGIILNVGQVQTFVAIFSGTLNVSVTWSCTSGTITSSGVFTATLVGRSTIRATSNVANLSASVQVTVSSSGTPGPTPGTPGTPGPTPSTPSPKHTTPTTSVGTPIGTPIGTPLPTMTITTVTPTPTVTPSLPGLVDLAFNKSANASTTFNNVYSPFMAIDGNPTSRWCASNADPKQWLIVDLGQVYLIQGTQVTFESVGIWEYAVSVATGNLWTRVVDRRSNTEALQTYADTFQSMEGRYVEINVTTPELGHWVTIYTFNVWGISGTPIVSPSPPTLPPSQTPSQTPTLTPSPIPSGIKNLAFAEPTTATSTFSSLYNASMATDDTNATRWCAGNGLPDQSLLVDLGSLHLIVATQVTWESFGVWQYRVEIANSSVFETVIDQTANTLASQTYYNTFLESARWVRINCTTPEPGHWVSIEDFQVFGY